MEKVAVVFTVLFEEPFWCGVYQRQEGRNLEAARMVFGAEPKEYEVLAFLLQNWKQLRFGSTDSAPCAVERKNPKRMQREAGKQTKEKGVGTKAQQALAALREEQKTERKVRSKAEKLAETERRFRLRQAKRLKKHKGH